MLGIKATCLWLRTAFCLGSILFAHYVPVNNYVKLRPWGLLFPDHPGQSLVTTVFSEIL